MKQKSIKDTIHGYIRIDEPFWRIIDTAEFQRLKWIEQTSYRVLYPSARHDRFIHSIGVYHLGQKAVNGFIRNCTKKDGKIILKYKKSFLLGCLLHDIGHAPFSHTCEDLYNYQERISNEKSPLNCELLTLYKDYATEDIYESFKNDYLYIIKNRNETCKPPSEHEIMSAIITIKNFNKFKSFFRRDEYLDLDLIIRAILGCVYAVKRSNSENLKRNNGIKNCLIRLLNSSTVDVDKLDYIARDTQMSGYDNVVLDNARLFDSICFIVKDDIYYPAFKKNALSVLNNVILAKNSQAQWIVNHPIVLYESYLLRKAIGISLQRIYEGIDENVNFDELLKSVFSSQSLSREGNVVNGVNISLLSDIEILHWMKQNISNASVLEYFSRDERKSPIWKSHEEFLFYLKSDLEKAKEISDFIAPLLRYLNKFEDLYLSKEINYELFEKIKSEEIDGKNEILKIIDVLLSYQDEKGDKNFEYVIIPAKNSFFAKINAKQVYISFDKNNRNYTNYQSLKDDTIELNNKKYEFFYLYSNKKINVKHYLDYLYEMVHNNVEIRT